jgi:hypothetical protein
MLADSCSRDRRKESVAEAVVFKANGQGSATQFNPRIRAGPSGIHVFERNSGLNVLLEEVRVSPARWSAAPRQVSIALTNACDSACSYCFAPKDLAALDAQQLVTWLDELDSNGCLGVGFGGGEPTLFPQFAEVCHYAAHSTGLAVSFTTNGHHLDGPLISALAGSVHFVRVSMDGVGPTYEALRGRPFAALRASLQRVRALSPFGINYVVNSRTLADLDAATSFAAGMGATEFLLLPEQAPCGIGGVDGRTMQALQRWVRAYQGTVRLAVSEAGAEGLPTCNPTPRETGLRAYAHIDAAGMLKESSYNRWGVPIGSDGVMAALALLRQRQTEGSP